VNRLPGTTGPSVTKRRCRDGNEGGQPEQKTATPTALCPARGASPARRCDLWLYLRGSRRAASADSGHFQYRTQSSRLMWCNAPCSSVSGLASQAALRTTASF
jgi:hypothetical protein